MGRSLRDHSLSAAWLQGWNQPSYPLHTALNGSAGNEGEPGVGCRELIVAAATGDVDRQRRGGCGRPRERQHGIRVCRDSPESRSRSLACAVSRSTGPVYVQLLGAGCVTTAGDGGGARLDVPHRGNDDGRGRDGA